MAEIAAGNIYPSASSTYHSVGSVGTGSSSSGGGGSGSGSGSGSSGGGGGGGAGIGGVGQTAGDVAERSSRLKCTSEQGRCLAYLTIKHMVRTQGPHFHKGVSLGLNTWTAITRELNALGIEKSPEQWRKCYSAAKYFAHMRFFRLMKEKHAVNASARPDWTEIEIRDLLYLQDLRTKGYPDMPEPDVLMRAFDNKQMYLNEYHASLKPPYNYPRDLFYDTNNYANAFGDFSQFSLQQMQENAGLNQDEVQIKSELEGSSVEASEDFHQQLQQMVDAHIEGGRRMEYTPSSRSQVTPPMPSISKASSGDQMDSTMPTATATAAAKATTTQRPRDSLDSEAHLLLDATAGLGPEHYYLERRLLEVSERLLKEKIKQTKILRKKNKILKQTRREQKKQADALNKMLELLLRRTNSI